MTKQTPHYADQDNLHIFALPYFTQGMEGVISDAKGLLCRVGV